MQIWVGDGGLTGVCVFPCVCVSLCVYVCVYIMYKLLLAGWLYLW